MRKKPLIFKSTLTLTREWSRKLSLLLVFPLLLRVQALFCKPRSELLIRTLEAGHSLTGRNAIQGQLQNTFSDLTYVIGNTFAAATFRSLDGLETLWPESVSLLGWKSSRALLNHDSVTITRNKTNSPRSAFRPGWYRYEQRLSRRLAAVNPLPPVWNQ